MQTAIISDYPIYPIKIPTPFAVGDVFSYLIVDEKIVLVDAGQYTNEAFSTLKEALREHQIEIEDIDEIWLTHGHPDHFGQASLLADRAGAVVYGHPKERANFAGNDNSELFEEFFNRHQIPPKLIEKMVEQLDWLQQFQLSIEPEWISEGEELSSGEMSVTVRHTPGHAPGHVAFETDNEIIFGGDVLLDHISTNALINFDPDSGCRNKSLLQYRESLRWIRESEGIVLPGHGKIIEDAAVVADQHLSEHEKRYHEITELLGSQPMTLMELSYNMFADAIKEGAIFLVLSEVLGYLDWGIEEGIIELDEQKMTYRIMN